VTLQILKSLLAFLTSAKVAVAVMAVLAGLSLVGAVVPQGGSQEAYLTTYGRIWGGLVWTLRLHNVFSADYFTTLLVFLCIMVFACALKRLPKTVRLARQKDLIFDLERLVRMASHQDLRLDVDAEEGALHVADICRHRLYSVTPKTGQAGQSLFASKMAFSRYGSLLLHLSFIFLLAGGVVITRLGFHYYQDVKEGKAFMLRTSGGDSVQVRVDDFLVETDERDRISDYVCSVSLSRSGETLLKYRIRPNHPLKFGRREVYLVSYDEVPSEPEGFVVSVYDSLGTLLIPHLVLGMDQPVHIQEIEAKVVASQKMVRSVRLLLDGGGVETYLIRDEPEPEAGGRFQFVLMYVIPSVVVTLEVVKEPFQGLIIGGLILLTVGTFMSLYLSHRRIWFIVSPLAEGKSRVVFAGTANRNREAFAQELEGIRRTLLELA
jgi:cytochrome c biogenesis protein